MVPMLIGDPVAATPGLDPHDDKLAGDPDAALVPVPVAAADDVAAAVDEPVAAPDDALELELELELPHPASARTPIAATRAAIIRLRDAFLRIRTCAPLH
jgi:hypothetical protein